MQQPATITAATSIQDDDLRPVRKDRGRPIHSMLVSFSAAYFAGALVTDLVYWQTPDVMWERFSIWLIFAGLVTAGLAIIAYAIDLAGRRRIERPAWPRAVGYALAIVSRGDKCLRSQPRRLYRGGTDRPDAFRAASSSFSC